MARNAFIACGWFLEFVMKFYLEDRAAEMIRALARAENPTPASPPRLFVVLIDLAVSLEFGRSLISPMRISSRSNLPKRHRSNFWNAPR
jgi:hypothetical protein